jgi:hypothetical protein
MGDNKEKFELVFDAQERASAKLRVLQNELAKLGGPEMVKTQRSINTTQRSIDMLSGSAKTASPLWTKFTQGIAIGNIATNAATAAFNGLRSTLSYIASATIAEEKQWKVLGGAISATGGSVTDAIPKFQAMTDVLEYQTGVADTEISGAFAQMTRALVPATRQYDIMKIAIDTATFSGRDLSDVVTILIKAYAGNETALNKLGTEFGIARDKGATFDEMLTKLHEKTIGAATAAMDGYAGVQRQSEIEWERTCETIGSVALPAWTAFLSVINDTAQGLSGVSDAMNSLPFTAQIDAAEAEMNRLMRQNATWSARGGVGVNLTWLFGGTEKDIREQAARIAKIKDNMWVASMINMDAPASKPQAVTPAAVDEENPAVTTIKETTAAAQEALTQLSTVGIPQAIEDTEEFTEESVTLASRGMVETMSAAEVTARRMGQHMMGMTANAVNSMVDNMVSGRMSFAETFKGIAQDFASFFIKQALAMVANLFIPGLGSLLGGIFDTPTNDRMAARQGGDFMRWFTRGAIAEAQGGSVLAAGITQSGKTIAPVGGYGGGGSGMVVMNVTISGNVLSDQYVERRVAPTLQRLATNGRSMLSLRGEHMTGGRDVTIG